MIETPKLNAEDVRRVIKAMREIDPEMVKDLRSGLKSNLGGFATNLANSVAEPPLSGFARGAGTGWAKSTGKVSFTPGRSRKTGNSLVSLRVLPRGGKRGLFIAELAGSRSSGLTARGAQMITNLNRRRPMLGRGGRFVYAEFRKQRPEVVDIATNILNRTFKALEKKL